MAYFVLVVVACLAIFAVYRFMRGTHHKSLPKADYGRIAELEGEIWGLPKVEDRAAGDRHRVFSRGRTMTTYKYGSEWTAGIPYEVPDYAHAEIIDDINTPRGFMWMMLTWTDQKTGEHKALRALATNNQPFQTRGYK